MRLVPVQTVPSTAIRLVLAGFATALLAGCSADATRFAENPFGTDSSPTASIPASQQGGYGSPQGGYGGAPVAPVTSQPLAPVSSAPLAPPPAQPALHSYAVPARPSPQASYRAPVAEPVSTGSIAHGTGGWSAEGGTPIVVAQGESAAMLATRYGVPADVLLRTNGFTSASQVQPGARLVIPVYGNRTAATPTSAPAHAAETPARVLPTRPGAKPPGQANAGERLQFQKGAEASSGQTHAQTHAMAPAKAAEVAKPVGKASKQVAEAGAAARQAAQQPVKPAAPARQQVAAAKPVVAPQVDRETTTASVAPEPAATAAVSDSDKPEFRWPARGRIIQGFKAGGNDGINIAVPEGTSVKAAEAGVVAYAGNELKGYGNLVLIRHPNGFVSAYANNGEISVKRGDAIKRGQIIAKSGQTGNVSSPQLHFELRKGSTPVDPTNYLAGL